MEQDDAGRVKEVHAYPGISLGSAEQQKRGVLEAGLSCE